MIKNYDQFKKFENYLISKDTTNIEKNFFIVEEMYKEAVELGALPMKDPLQDLNIDINLAKILNGIPKTNNKNSF